MATDASTAWPGRRRAPIGRYLLIGAVLAWFAVLILVPSIALVRAALARGLGPFFDALASGTMTNCA